MRQERGPRPDEQHLLLEPDADALRARAEWLERQGRAKEAKADRARLDMLLRRHDAGGDPPAELPTAA